jgi:hypothetical protein
MILAKEWFTFSRLAVYLLKGGIFSPPILGDKCRFSTQAIDQWEMFDAPDGWRTAGRTSLVVIRRFGRHSL